jgi:hypothetical protein
LKPVNAIETVLNGAPQNHFTSDFRPKLKRMRRLATNLVRISRLLLHCCNTRDAIEGEMPVALRSSLVIPFMEDQDKCTNKDPAPNRMGAGENGRVD